MPRSRREQSRDKLLKAALPHVVFDGWSERTVQAAARDVGLPPEDGRRLFPGGAPELVEAFSLWADSRMLAALAREDLSALRTGERVARAIRARLTALAPHREAARRAAAFFALPNHAALGARCLYRTVDAIWYGIGDRALDFSFYTKRATLAGIYGATLLVWLDDDSDGFAATWAFLDRRLGDLGRITRLRGQLERMGEHLPNPFRIFRAFNERRRAEWR